MTLSHPQRVEFILTFPGRPDRSQLQELRAMARRLRLMSFSERGRRCCVVHGTMTYAGLAGLTFARRGSDCVISVPARGIDDQPLWLNRG